MESRNISLTTCGERLDHSPRDRKAVSDIYDLFQPAVAATAVCYPLYNLIPEIISDENLERSFKRVMANLRSADTRSGNRQREIAVIDGIECSPRMARYVKNKHKILDALKEQIGNGTFRIKNLKSFTVDDGPKVRIVQAPSVIERIGSNAIMEPLEKHLSPLLKKQRLHPYKDADRMVCSIRCRIHWQRTPIYTIIIKAIIKDIMTVLTMIY